MSPSWHGANCPDVLTSFLPSFPLSCLAITNRLCTGFIPMLPIPTPTPDHCWQTEFQCVQCLRLKRGPTAYETTAPVLNCTLSFQTGIFFHFVSCWTLSISRVPSMCVTKAFSEQQITNVGKDGVGWGAPVLYRNGNYFSQYLKEKSIRRAP